MKQIIAKVHVGANKKTTINVLKTIIEDSSTGVLPNIHVAFQICLGTSVIVKVNDLFHVHYQKNKYCCTTGRIKADISIDIFYSAIFSSNVLFEDIIRKLAETKFRKKFFKH